MQLPYLTRHFAGIGGSIKQQAEDFFVQEIPAYEASGEGEHTYAEIQKINLTTMDAVNQIAGALGVSPRDIGYAGLKDARALTRQVISIFGTTPEAVMNLHVPNITVQWAARHGNKLRLGHLSGNRFAIKIRDVTPTDVIKLRPVIDVLEKRGMPNYFGEQRFGRRGDNHMLGAALVRNDDAALLKHLLGSPDPSLDDMDGMRARAAFDSENYELAMRLFPRRSGMERRVLARFIKTQNAAAAVKTVDERLRRLWVSALQSHMFNEVLARRIDTIDKLFDGDIACKESGACFPVELAAVEQPRCDAFEISPTGPLVGYRMRFPEKEPLAIEQTALAAMELKPENFRSEGRHKVKGARRALRVRPKDIQLEGGVDAHGAYITVAFTLPAGSYATMFLRELMKTDSAEPTAAGPA
ncbi:MAG TPA: tRNA pseudouridine(13) synthase TruD [Tepidisphaeraceae bacterium]|jgi:tRNA pseudouridine13 synthase